MSRGITVIFVYTFKFRKVATLVISGDRVIFGLNMWVKKSGQTGD